MLVKVGWKTKAFVQGALSHLPAGKNWNQAIQRHITKSLVLDQAKFRTKLGFARGHWRNLARAKNRRESPEVLELGTGRFPIVPLYMFLCGAARVVSLDIIGLLRDDTVRDTLLMYRSHLAEGHLPEARPERARQLLQAIAAGECCLGMDILPRFHIETVIGDASHTGLPAHTFDLLASNTTLEHIPREMLRAILAHFGDLARPGAMMSHFIDMRDHYAEWDHSITVYNFLRYSQADWRWFNNSLLYQNRLRISDYRSLHAQAGWDMVWEEADPGSASELDRVPLASEFRRYAEEDLLAPTCWMVSQSSCVADERDAAGSRKPGVALSPCPTVARVAVPASEPV